MLLASVTILTNGLLEPLLDDPRPQRGQHTHPTFLPTAHVTIRPEMRAVFTRKLQYIRHLG